MEQSTNNELSTVNEIESVYVATNDMTFIMKHEMQYRGDKPEEVISTEVVGFYFGSPSDEDTAQFNGSLKATFIGEVTESKLTTSETVFLRELLYDKLDELTGGEMYDQIQLLLKKL